MIIEDILQMEHNEKPNEYFLMSMVGLEVRIIWTHIMFSLLINLNTEGNIIRMSKIYTQLSIVSHFHTK